MPFLSPIGQGGRHLAAKVGAACLVQNDGSPDRRRLNLMLRYAIRSFLKRLASVLIQNGHTVGDQP
jgi:hypothetical protein